MYTRAPANIVLLSDLVLGGTDAKHRKREIDSAVLQQRETPLPLTIEEPVATANLAKRASDYAVLLQQEINATADSVYFLTFRLGLSGFSTDTPSSLSLKINTLTSAGLVDIFVYKFSANQEATRYYASGQVNSDLRLLTFYAEISDKNVPITVSLDDIVFVTYNATSGVGLIDG